MDRLNTPISRSSCRTTGQNRTPLRGMSLSVRLSGDGHVRDMSETCRVRGKSSPCFVESIIGFNPR
jgi:hypothetical protein